MENPEKLPHGITGLAERINALGLKFGLWFEPEMISPGQRPLPGPSGLGACTRRAANGCSPVSRG